MVSFNTSARALTNQYESQGGTVADGVRSKTYSDSLKSACSASAAEVMTTGDAVQRVSVLPWHGAIRDAQNAYVNHSNAWASSLKACARDPASMSQSSVDIRATFAILGPVLRTAVPIRAMNDLSARVEKIMAD
jgi:hypothetical protein